VADRRQALVLIELQVDYFADDELARCRDDLVATCNRLVAAARRADVPVIEVRTVHDPGASTWTITMREDSQGVALAGSPGVEPLAGLATAEAMVVEKTRDSAFFATELLHVLRQEEVEHLVICGASTESCVLATAIDAFAHDLPVTIVWDGTASVRWELHDQTLTRLQHQYRQEVTTGADVQPRWLTGSGRPIFAIRRGQLPVTGVRDRGRRAAHGDR
jgi:nicotinamidase-related amidase